MELVIYLAKSAAILSMFYLVFFFFLRNDTLFTAKRFFFITGIITAIVLPFLKISKIIYIEAPVFKTTPLNLSAFNTIETIATTTPEVITINWWQIIFISYILVAIFLAVRFFVQLFSLLRLFNKSEPVYRGGFKYIEVTDKISPFSFFNYIVYNPTLHTQTELEMIVAHEQIHGKQLHSIDIFLGQFITVIQWANPFSWWYKKALEANLEFVADQETIPKIASKKQYQLTLVKASSSLPAPALTSPFYQSLIKKRIIMLNKTTTHKRNLFKMAIVLPLLAFFFLSFNVTEEIAYKDPIINTAGNLIITSETLETEITVIKNTINTSTDAFEVDFTDLKRDASGNLTQLVIKTRFTNQKSFIRNVTYGGDNTQIPAIKLKVTEGQLQFGDLKETSVMRVTERGVTALIFPKKKSATSSKEKMGKNPLYIINGKEILKSALPKDVIFEVSEYIEMIYPKEATKKYGVKGKDGVIVFKGTTIVNEDTSVIKKDSISKSQGINVSEDKSKFNKTVSQKKQPKTSYYYNTNATTATVEYKSKLNK